MEGSGEDGRAPTTGSGVEGDSRMDISGDQCEDSEQLAMVGAASAILVVGSVDLIISAEVVVEEWEVPP